MNRIFRRHSTIVIVACFAEFGMSGIWAYAYDGRRNDRFLLEIILSAYIPMWVPSLPVAGLLIFNWRKDASKYLDYLCVCVGLFSSGILGATVWNSYFHQNDWSLHVAFACIAAAVQTAVVIGIDLIVRGGRIATRWCLQKAATDDADGTG